ncbi:MAG: hypothetical protein ACOCXQ_03785 [Patescibacteria group bacterium]
MAHRDKGIGVGLLLGAAIGAAAALFLSPRSGKENRKLAQQKIDELKTFIENKEAENKIRQIFGEVNEKTRKTYALMQKNVDERIESMKDSIDKFDTKKYTTIVNDVLDNIKKEVDISNERADKAKKYLLSFIEEKQQSGKVKKKEIESEAKKKVERIEDKV